MNQSSIADKLAKRFFTRDPFVLARAMDRIVVERPLRGVRGYYQHMEKCHMIFVSDKLSGFERQFVCAHELGHSILHADINAIFFDGHTHFVKEKYETEADRFALDLIMPDDRFSEYMGMSSYDVADALCVSEGLIRSRMIQMKCGL